MTVKVGALLWPQTESWAPLRDAAVRGDRAGLDSLWTWDHLMAIVGPWEQPILEGWATLAALASLTDHATLGLMVGANTFRNPGLTAKLATTLDHVSGGRAVLGIGGAWFGREHDAFGIDFGSGFGERLDRLDESVSLIRRLLDGERIAEHVGPAYRMHDALVAPRPVQPRLPILIGGSGPQKTLRTTARYADAWNAGGSLEDLRKKDAILRERCAEVGRNPDEIERTTSVWMTIRDDPHEARRVLAANAAANGDSLSDDDVAYVGTPEQIADRLRPIVELGFEHVIVDLMAPYDAETLERLPDVRERLAR
ncbi:MAG TPA: LLM class flavin-dependent oxidoreductase [Candidatus Limnocylindrales bacterium]|nr:LLM class flavin-dependent oxidoreductase [Candidatus Limnocylindrales bacterium]